MENYGNNNGYPPYPPPYGYPPTPYPPPPPPGYLQPSNSFSGHPSSSPSPGHSQQYSHSGPLQYPTPGPAVMYSPSPPHAYGPPYAAHPYPYAYGYPPSPFPPYDTANTPVFHHPAAVAGGSGRIEASAAADLSAHGSGRYGGVYDDSSSHRPSCSDSFSASDRPHLSHQSSSSSSAGASLYPPIDEVLANVHISDRPFPDSSTPSVPPPSYHHQPHPSFSESFHAYPSPPPPPVTPYGSHHGAAPGMQIVPYTSGPLKDQPSLKVLLLHGSLDIWVHCANNLPNMDMFSKTIGDMLGPRLTSTLSGKLEHMSNMTSDPYVTVMVSEAVVARTYVVSNSENPVWTQHFNVPVAHHTAEVRFLVKDSDVVGAQLIGTVSIPAERIFNGERVEGIFPIMADNGKQCKQGAVLNLSIQYIPIGRISMYHSGVGAGPNYFGVPGTYFPLRRGCKVTLYQDAHVPDDCLPDLRLGNGMRYEHGKCWHDIFEAISQARRLVYITGWSVFHTVRLVRDGYVQSPTIGELLKSKSQEGVRVLLIIWDDPTSRNILGYQTDGIMGTRDEETRRFFKHSSVQVLLCPRTVGKRHSFMRQQEAEKIYTHHQKQVVVDADAGNYRRKIIAFVGGLDLCGGRYDIPSHPLFRTLQSVHKDDYHNPNFGGTDYSGPREPWHDLHSKIDGPAAYDVLKNFEERWLKAAKRHGIKKLKRSYDDSLLKLDRITDIVRENDSLYQDDRDPETWHVQIFRSIDSNSAKGFPKDPREASQKNLVCGKNVLIDTSIHTAYVHAIRAAQHFIYIENQYFLGSSFNWDSHKNLGADNLIPMEIALKIANKIKANERFSAYIVIPMWPEGNPNGIFLQKILYWQNKTMQMMYETIYTALKEAGLDDVYEPQDYLNFFCLGAREAYDLDDASRSAANTDQGLAKKNRRFMIYVHSKGMIVDDEYVIIGSANINQRSLEGNRDTEVAMGAYQPQHTWARMLSGPRGQIYGYRMALWAEHIGCVEECFTHPESLECMRRVRDIGLLNWKQYVAEEVTEMRGHLLKYPLEVDRKGKVRAMPGHESFPDIGGQITGSFATFQENLTI